MKNARIPIWPSLRLRQVGDTPVDLLQAVPAQNFIRARKGTAAKKSAMGRQRTGMRGCDDVVARRIDPFLLLLGMAAPQNKHNGRLPFIQHIDHPIRERFPSDPFVRIGLATAHG